MAGITVWKTRFPGQMERIAQCVAQARAQHRMTQGVMEGNILLVVPSSHTLQMEMELIRMLHLPGLLNLKILSPANLVTLVREQSGTLDLEPLNERGRCMALSEALMELEEAGRLQFYTQVAYQSGLAPKISELLSEIAMAGYNPQILQEMSDEAGSVSGAGRMKMQDLSAIWDTYEQLIEPSFLDEPAQWEQMLQQLPACGLLRETDLIIACFTTLTRDLCRLSAVAAGGAKSVQIVLMSDSSSGDAHLFEPAESSLSILMKEAKDAGAELIIREDRSDVQRTEALRFLERHLFSHQQLSAQAEIPDLQGISLHFARNTYRETLVVAETLKRWHREGIAWDEMAVLPMAPEEISSMLSVTLRTAGIPFYLKREDTAMRHGLSHMLLSSVRAVCLGYQQADMIGILKSGFAAFTPEESMLLENYALEKGVNRTRWKQPFTTRKKGEEDKVARLESLRIRLMEPLEKLRSVLAGRRTGARRAAEGIYAYLISVDAYGKLKEREQELSEHGFPEEMDANRQIWGILCDLLDQMVALMGERHIRIAELPRILEAALRGTPVRVLPPTLNRVRVEAPGSLIGNRYRAVIVMGMQDRDYGRSSKLISEKERSSLSEWIRHPVGVTEKEEMTLRLLRGYCAISLPTERLLVTASATGTDGSVMRPSNVFLELEHMVRRSHPEQVTGGLLERLALPLSPQLALEELAVRLRLAQDDEGTVSEKLRHAGLEGEWLKTLRWLYRSPMWHDKTQRLFQGLVATNEMPRLSPEASRILFHDDLMSVTRLETFATCPFSHFVEYGLRPIERGKYLFEADVRGSFYHDVLQRFGEQAIHTQEWPNLSEAQVDHMLEQILQPIREEWKDGPLGEDLASEALASEYIRNVSRTARLITKMAQTTPFEVMGLETIFGAPEQGKLTLPPVVLELSEGERVALTGKIDRLDVYTDPQGRKLVRVLDYKSSFHELNTAGMEYGLQLQLPLYLQAAVQGIPGAVPAGALYQVVRDPLVEVGDDAQETADQARKKKLQMKGMVLDDETVRDAMGDWADVPQRRMSSQSCKVVSPEEMQEKLDTSVKRAAELTREVRSGIISPAPATATGTSPCEFCRSRPLCPFDRRLPGGKIMDLRSPGQEG